MVDGVDGNLQDMSLEHLRGLSWPLAKPVLRGEETLAAATNRELRGIGRAYADTTEICTAAPRVASKHCSSAPARSAPAHTNGHPAAREHQHG